MLVSGFDHKGGFYVIDHERRRAAYAYPSSDYATKAKRNPAQVREAMGRSLDQEGIQPHIWDNSYVAVLGVFAGKRYPYCIQCTDRDSGRVGCFAYNPEEMTDGNFHAITPVCDDLAAFYGWCHANNFGIHHGRGQVITNCAE